MSITAVDKRRTLGEYLNLGYLFNVIADLDGGYVIEYPDLPGCIAQVETLDEVVPVAEDARRAWLETAYELGREIPLPSYREEYSGKFNVRLPKSLHRKLAEAAEREGVSLNTYVVELLSRGDTQVQLLRRLEGLEQMMSSSLGGLRAQPSGIESDEFGAISRRASPPSPESPAAPRPPQARRAPPAHGSLRSRSTR